MTADASLHLQVFNTQGGAGPWLQQPGQALPAAQSVSPSMGPLMQPSMLVMPQPPGPMQSTPSAATAAPVPLADAGIAQPAPVVTAAPPAAHPAHDPFLPTKAQTAVADPFGAAQAAQQQQDPFYAPLATRLAQRTGGGRPLGEGKCADGIPCLHLRVTVPLHHRRLADCLQMLPCMLPGTNHSYLLLAFSTGMESTPYGQAPYPYANLAGAPGPMAVQPMQAAYPMQAMQPMQAGMPPPEQQLVQPFIQSPSGSPAPAVGQHQGQPGLQLAPAPYTTQPPLPYMQHTILPTPAMQQPGVSGALPMQPGMQNSVPMQPGMQSYVPMQPMPGVGGMPWGITGYGGPMQLPPIGPDGLPLPGYGYAAGPYPPAAIDPMTGQPMGPVMPNMGPPVVLPPPPGFTHPTAQQPLMTAPAAAPATQPAAGPQKWEFVRVFSWQEKVASKSEVAAAQHAALAAAAGQDTYGGVDQQQGQQQGGGQRRGRRTMALGSQTAADLQSRGTRLVRGAVRVAVVVVLCRCSLVVLPTRFASGVIISLNGSAGFRELCGERNSEASKHRIDLPQHRMMITADPAAHDVTAHQTTHCT